MCSCETSFGSIFLFEIGASVDGAPVVNLTTCCNRTTLEAERSPGLSQRAATPGTSSLLLKHPTKNTILEGSELLENVVHWKVKPISFELTNERGQIFAIIHSTNLKLQFSTTECILSLLFDPGRI